jgi:putative hydrolase of the HAD superfamily
VAAFSSASIGYEKPHPAIFRRALAAIPAAGPVWMIGDNPVADVAGAEALGLPAILVRRSARGVRWQSPDLAGVVAILEAQSAIQ